MSNSQLLSFTKNGDNIKCLRTFAYACSQLGKQPIVIETISKIYDDLCFNVMGRIFSKGANDIQEINTDLVRTFAELIHKITELDINILVNSKYLNDLITLF